MTINERIKGLGSYFKGFNITNDTNTSFILINFPETWKVFDEKELNEKYDVYTGKKEEGTYFITETANGIDCLFDAVEYVIATNKALEEKTELFKAKTVELRDLFVSEPLEKLKTLEFTFNTKKTTRKPKNVVKKEVIEEVVEETKPEPVETVVEEEPVKKETKKATKKNNIQQDSDTMSFMKEFTGDKK